MSASFQRCLNAGLLRCACCSLMRAFGPLQRRAGSRAEVFDPQGAPVARAPVKVVNAAGTSVAFALRFARLEICYDFRVLGKNR